MRPSLRRAQAWYFYRHKTTEWLLVKRIRSAATMLALEDVLAERGFPALPARLREHLRVMLHIGVRGDE